MKNEEINLEKVWWALRLGVGLTAFLAGLDKFFYLLADWDMYLSPFFQSLLPMSPQAFMGLVGIVEMSVGLSILTRWTRLGAYVASAWLSLISINLLVSGTFLDVAVRDLVMALGAFTLARLTEWKETVYEAKAQPVGSQRLSHSRA